MCKEFSPCFLLKILMDFFFCCCVVLGGGGSERWRFDLVTVAGLSPKYMPLCIFRSLFIFISYFSHETLINWFVVRVQHQKYVFVHILLFYRAHRNTLKKNAKRTERQNKKKKTNSKQHKKFCKINFINGFKWLIRGFIIGFSALNDWMICLRILILTTWILRGK